MQSQLANAVQRAQHRTAGHQSVDILVETAADQAYTLIAYVSNYFQVKSLAAVLASGTITLAVSRIRAGVTVAVGGLTALASSSTRATADATGDDTSLFIPGDQLIITGSLNSSGISLAASVIIEPMGSGA